MEPTTPSPSPSPSFSSWSPPTQGLSRAGGDLLAEARHLRHLMRELARAGLDLRAHPGSAFAVVKVAEAERVVLGLLLDVTSGPDGWTYDLLGHQVAAIARDKRQRLLQDLPKDVRRRLLQGLETVPPPEEEVWALVGGLARSSGEDGVGSRDAIGGYEIPLADRHARRLAARLCGRASSPATWEDLWRWP